ncbi:endopolyphosphatase [Malassezia cuniculi]|uniref:Endopolyphosphatase n=1 Tax=Malassezia cuniculi TaxID=948313 RepID=A0AAF0EQH4_9BASI|nr:endopolyphosphatase [Malassezia cuniculi]
MLLFLGLACLVAQGLATQQPFFAGGEHATTDPVSHGGDGVLSGRFLHITDMHVDRNYKEDSSVVSTCHRNTPHHRHGGAWRAGHWGTGVSDCDSPPRLINHTLAWVRDNWNVSVATGSDTDMPTHMFDFVIWTGDSARHDQDPQLLRTEEEIVDSNRFTIHAMESTFPDIPIVPNIGNNDIVLHNTMVAGPSDETRRFAKLWKDHLPPEAIETVVLGGYFSKDVLADHLAVISLNTLYFYDSNKATDGCPRRHKKDTEVDAGTLQLEWMARELARYRRRNMQVHIIGHVPPTAGNYFPDCYDAYTELVLRFQDTIVGQHFGHMNMDAFFVQESSAVAADIADVEDARVLSNNNIEEDLRYDFEVLPGPARVNMDYYGTFFLSPSVVPTYFPSLRVWTYNTTPAHDNRPYAVEDVDLETMDVMELNDILFGEEADEPADLVAMGRTHRRPARKHRRRNRKLPRYASPNSPSRTNTFLTPLGYSEWVLNIDRANEEYEHVHKKAGRAAADELRPEYELEYVTYEGETLWHQFIDDSDHECALALRHHETPAEHHVPVPLGLLMRHLQKYNLESPFHRSSTDGVCRIARPLRDVTMYSTKDMTLRSVMDLARRLVLDSKMWDAFVRRLYTNSVADSK